MAKDVRLNYLYLEPVTRSRFDTVCDELGWPSKGLVSQCCQAFFKVNRDYYAQAAIADCKARGMKETDYYKALRDGSEDDLSPYLVERPLFGANPLATVPAVPTGKDNKRRYNTLTLSGYNATLLKVAQIVDMGSLTMLVSRIVKQHFEGYWEKIYTPQLELDKACKFK